MKIKTHGNLTIAVARLTAKTKAGRDKQWKRIMEQSDAYCRQLEIEEMKSKKGTPCK